MFFWALLFFIVAVAAAILRFSGSTIVPPTISMISFYSSLALSFLILLIGIIRKPPRV
ncbi:MAG: hypothetical protein JW915_17115 [Chitinispirillaceae bacterium]|nr:hypothetical protein [Chitinispirillaceae bacterium]